jgi:hypothetical protein
MKKKKIILIATPKDLKKLANSMSCCTGGPTPVKPEE